MNSAPTVPRGSPMSWRDRPLGGELLRKLLLAGGAGDARAEDGGFSFALGAARPAR